MRIVDYLSTSHYCFKPPTILDSNCRHARKMPLRRLSRAFLLSDSTAWTKLEQFNGEQVARFFQVITFPQRELCARYSTMISN